jgi:peptidoglycan hydrolase-like amidase
MMKSQSWNRLIWVAIPIGFASLSLPLLLSQTNALPQLAKLLTSSSRSNIDQPPDSAWVWHRQLMRQSLTAGRSSAVATNPAEPTPGSITPTPASRQPRNYAKVLAPAASEIPVEMRVAIATETNSLAIATSTSGYIFDNTGKFLRELPAQQPFYAQTDGQTIRLGPRNTASTIWIQPAQGGYVYVGEHWYRGKVKLIVQNTGLLAVNYVNLDDYLYSVVGSEMPSSWPLAALKAQAIAARSYALAQYIRPRHSNDLYHMGSTEAWQVYKGLEGEATATHQAVDSTAGLFLSYKGGLVESLYAATDDIVAQAHGGRGMSQTGALNLAQQGYDYLHILGAYYPGAGVSRIDTKESDTD